MVRQYPLNLVCLTQPEIYQALLSNYGLKASETVFLDDMPYNVKGAKAVGMAAIQFTNAVQCENSLQALGVNLID
ncbi:HAD superfamily hydrolase (fragment) [Vibrio coralliirubri]